MKRSPKPAHMKAGCCAKYRKKVGIEIIEPAAKVMSCPLCQEPMCPGASIWDYWHCSEHLHGKLYPRSELMYSLVAFGGCHGNGEAAGLLQSILEQMQINAGQHKDQIKARKQVKKQDAGVRYLFPNKKQSKRS